MTGAAQGSRGGAKHHKGESRQDFETPPDFLCAVEGRFGRIDTDLAATRENAKALHFIGPDEDSLAPLTRWPVSGVSWLNPPFANIRPWAEKCAAAPRALAAARILLLVPAAVGSNWYAKNVHDKAHVYFLNNRIQFVGAKFAYPKDCMLAVYGEAPGFTVWRWRDELPEPAA